MGKRCSRDKFRLLEFFFFVYRQKLDATEKVTWTLTSNDWLHEFSCRNPLRSLGVKLLEMEILN